MLEGSVKEVCEDTLNYLALDLSPKKALNLMVSDLASLYGHWYGRKMMQGSLRAQLGVISGAISQREVSVAL